MSTGSLSMTQVVDSPAGGLSARAVATKRIVAVDALRGFVMLLMLVDHAREFFFMHAQVSDPVDLTTTPPGLFFTRLAAHLCAPVFVALTGLSAWLYGQRRGGKRAASGVLLKRGLFLIVLELTLVNFAWTFSLTPATYFLQVIWAIGWSMVALAGLLWLPRLALLGVGLAIVFGHNLLWATSSVRGSPRRWTPRRAGAGCGSSAWGRWRSSSSCAWPTAMASLFPGCVAPRHS